MLHSQRSSYKSRWKLEKQNHVPNSIMIKKQCRDPKIWERKKHDGNMIIQCCFVMGGRSAEVLRITLLMNIRKKMEDFFTISINPSTDWVVFFNAENGNAKKIGYEILSVVSTMTSVILKWPFGIQFFNSLVI